jgi:hypothetical protein
MAPETPSANNLKSRLDVAESVAKITSLVLIPIVIPLSLAIYSSRIQEATQRESINRDYVQLAVGILREKNTDVSPGLRNWAVDLLAERSPTKFGSEVVAELKSGTVNLPGSLNSIYWNQHSAISTDRKTLAYVNSGALLLKDTANGHIRRITTDIANPIAVDISSDGKTIAAADGSGTIVLWSSESMAEVGRIQVKQDLSTMRFKGSDRGEVSLVDMTIYVYDLSGRLSEQFGTIAPHAVTGLKVSMQ